MLQSRTTLHRRKEFLPTQYYLTFGNLFQSKQGTWLRQAISPPRPSTPGAAPKLLSVAGLRFIPWVSKKLSGRLASIRMSRLDEKSRVYQ
jgi:hypothetical protein